MESARLIWEHLRRQFASRGAVVFSSAELDEILNIADRVLVFFDGRIVRDLPIGELDYQDVAVITRPDGTKVTLWPGLADISRIPS